MNNGLKHYFNACAISLLYLWMAPIVADTSNFDLAGAQQTFFNHLQQANSIQNSLQSEQNSILPPEQAFQLSARIADDNRLIVHWDIPEDIYLYEEKFSFDVLEGGQLGLPEIPEGLLKDDEIFGEQIVHFGPLTVSIPLLHRSGDHLVVNISYQGCSENGFCYPPMTQTAYLDFAATTSQSQVTWVNEGQGFDPTIPLLARHEQITQMLFNQNLLVILLTFLGFGLLLTFTPCVLPMVPILAGIIVGANKQVSKRQAFTLSSTYVLGMAATYTIVGILAGLAGSGLAASFQKTWVVAMISGVFVLLALSMFNLYQLKLPASVETWLSKISQRQKGGTYLGVLLMGVLSALIISPCVTAPLVGALAYISQTGNASLGGLALLSLSLGMGIPLIIASTFGAHYLPKSGAWMNVVKAVFGVLLLATAIWLLERILPGTLALFLWAALLIVTAVYLGAFEASSRGWERLWKGLGCILFSYGLILLLGVGLGNNNPLRPLEGIKLTHDWNQLSNPSTQPTNSLFKPVKSLADVNQELILARGMGKPVLLDFYADWCSACIVMKRTTFSNPEVQALLSQNFIVLQADVTANDSIDRALQRHFSIFAPPAILFFAPDGQEMQGTQIVGEQGPLAFKKHLNHVLAIANS